MIKLKIANILFNIAMYLIRTAKRPKYFSQKEFDIVAKQGLLTSFVVRIQNYE